MQEVYLLVKSLSMDGLVVVFFLLRSVSSQLKVISYSIRSKYEDGNVNDHMM
jgi:hypothetical protein